MSRAPQIGCIAAAILLILSACSGDGTSRVDGSIDAASVDASLDLSPANDIGVESDASVPDTSVQDMRETPCSAGFAGTVESGCTDIDECLTGNGGCGSVEIATCTNTVGGRTCECDDVRYTLIDSVCVRRWAHGAYIKASNTDVEDWFGHSVAISADGSRLVVGAWNEDSNATGIDGVQTNNDAGSSGAVYVFARSGSSWLQEAYIKASNSGPYDYFGQSVALSADGSRLAVGAFYEGSNATGVGNDQFNNIAGLSGAVYVFARSGSSWSQEAYVKASNTGDEDYFGHSVALSADGDRLAVGAWGEDSNATGIGGAQANDDAGASGAVYLFSRSGSTWSQEAYVKASNTGAGDRFGHSVALSADGDRLAVGARDESSNATGVGGDQTSNGARMSGAVYLFSRSGSTWSQEAYVKASNTGVDDNFGQSVALSADGSRLVVGAHFEGSSATGVNGEQTNNDAMASGAVYVFARSGSIWSQEAYVKASSTGFVGAFGFSVALSSDGSRLTVGAPFESSRATGIDGDQENDGAQHSGAVYAFTRSGSTWSQEAYVKASNTGADDRFGHSVALSANGDRLAVGARGESSNAIGVGGNQTNNSASEAGAAYTYERHE